MAAHGRRRNTGEQENEERWLLTYSDMITLLMALFMVLFSISSVNVSKYKTLQQALQNAFSSAVLTGGKSVMQSGSQSDTKQNTSTTSLTNAIAPTLSQGITASTLQQATDLIKAARQEQQSFVALKKRLDNYLSTHGLADQVKTVITARGLDVRVLTDKVLFDSGAADLKPAGLPLLAEMSSLLNVDTNHPIVVEGHTDNQPISTSQYPSNWELSTARATNVVRYLISKGVNRMRLSASGYADLHPVASNGSTAGRQLNRRVEIVLQRNTPQLGN